MQEHESTLFEIPVYSMSEKDFMNRWDKKRKQLFDELISHNHTEESARQGVSNIYYPQWLWKYNQIVGYIKVSVTKSDVNLDLYCIMSDRHYADSQKKHYIVDWRLNGTHFYAVGKSDDYIKQEILSWLKSIEKNHLKRKYYVDYSTFNNIFKYINIKEIMDNL